MGSSVQPGNSTPVPGYSLANPLGGIECVSVPREICRMGPKSRIRRQMNAVQLFFKETSQLCWNLVVGYEQPIIVGEGNQVAIEQPVHGSAKGNAVLHNIRATIGNGLNVS